MAIEDYLSIGKICGAHGIHGKLRIHFYSDDPSIIGIASCLFIRGQTDNQLRPITVTEWGPHSHVVLLSCKEITSRSQAEDEKGGELVILRSDLPDPGEGVYYWADIIGLPVVTMENVCIGHLKEILPTGGNDVYVVYNAETGEETLIPAIKSVVRDMDLDAGFIRVSLPETME